MDNSNSLELKKIESNPEVKTVQKRAPELQKYAEALSIKTAEDSEQAIAVLNEIKDHTQLAEKTRRFFTDPHNAFVKRINEYFKQTTSVLGLADSTIRRKLVDYNNAVAKKADEAKAKVMKQIDAGKINVEEGVKKIENVKEPEKTVRTDEGTLSFTIRLQVEVEDETKIPREYLAPDMGKIKPVALALHKAGQKQIPGVKVVEVKEPRLRSNSLHIDTAQWKA